MYIQLPSATVEFVFAPAERDVYRQCYEPNIRAPAERNVSDKWYARPTYVSLRWSEEKSLGGRAFYKHLAPNGAKATMFCCTSKLNPPVFISHLISLRIASCHFVDRWPAFENQERSTKPHKEHENY